MKSILLSYCLLFMSSALICAQTINDGLYVNEERNEFVVVKNDTIQFRRYNDDGLATFIIGEGILEMKKQEKYMIRPLLSLMEKMSVLYNYPRNDNELSIQILRQDSLPMIYGIIIISRLQDKKPYMMAFSDKNGYLFLDKKQIEYFDNQDVLISVKCVGCTSSKNKTFLKRGYDYVIISRVPPQFSGPIAQDNKIEIWKLNEDEIAFRIETSSMSKLYEKDTIIKLNRIIDDYPFTDFPFDIDIKKNRKK